MDNVRSLECLKNFKGLESNFLTWNDLRLSVPKDKVSYLPPVKFDPMIFKYNITEFDTYSGKSLLIINKAKYPKRFITLSADLELSNTLQVFSIPYNVAGGTFSCLFSKNY